MEQSVGALWDAPPTSWFRSFGTGGSKEGKRSSNRKEEKEAAEQTEIGELGHRIVQDCAEQKQGRRLHDGFAQVLRTGRGTDVSWRKWMMEQLGCAGQPTVGKLHAHMHAEF